jgi:putative two-component system response regulator
MSEKSVLPKVLVVDDTPNNIRILVATLKDMCELVVARDGEEALARVAGQDLPDLILLDIMMPGLDGYEICSRLKDQPLTKAIPIIFITALASSGDEERGLKLGAVDYITKPFVSSVVRARVRTHLELKSHRDKLEDLVYERTVDLRHAQSSALVSLAALAEFRDSDTGAHIQRSSVYVRVIAQALAVKTSFQGMLDQVRIEQLEQSAPLHDIGKVGIPDSLLRKPGRFTEEEMKVMRRHPYMGYKALRVASRLNGKASFLDTAMDIALSHHERWDGKGYPRRLSGERIPLSGRIMALADVYDALRSSRPYKESFSHGKSREIIGKEMQGAFDPRIVEAFLEREDEFEKTAGMYVDQIS